MTNVIDVTDYYGKFNFDIARNHITIDIIIIIIWHVIECYVSF